MDDTSARKMLRFDIETLLQLLEERTGGLHSVVEEWDWEAMSLSDLRRWRDDLRDLARTPTGKR